MAISLPVTWSIERICHFCHHRIWNCY